MAALNVSAKNYTHKSFIFLVVKHRLDRYIITAPAGAEKDIKALLQKNLPIVLFTRFYCGTFANYARLQIIAEATILPPGIR